MAFVDHVANVQEQLQEEAACIKGKTQGRFEECLSFLRDQLLATVPIVQPKKMHVPAPTPVLEPKSVHKTHCPEEETASPGSAIVGAFQNVCCWMYTNHHCIV